MSHNTRSTRPGSTGGRAVMGATLARRERMAEVLVLHVAGNTDRAIGERLSVSHTQVRRDRQAALGEITRPAAEEVLKVTHARLEELYRLAHIQAIGGDVPAINAAVNVLDKIMRLYRLDQEPHGGAFAAVGTLLDQLLTTEEDVAA